MVDGNGGGGQENNDQHLLYFNETGGQDDLFPEKKGTFTLSPSKAYFSIDLAHYKIFHA